MKYLSVLLIFIYFSTFSYGQDSAQEFKFGADVFFAKYFYLIEGERVGVICNQASVLRNGVHIVDSLLRRNSNIIALFSPEHGIRGEYQAGVKFSDEKDSITGLKVYSLYGKTQKPTKQMLENIDVLIFDLQDIGSRFYTYTITMFYAMQAAAENGKKFIILDRPNPINGVEIEGPVLNLKLKSNVGIFPVPVRHGMTIGEIAKMIVGEKWLGNNLNLSLNVIPMENWNREKYFDELQLSWISPSPNIKSISSAITYPGVCFLEATNVSEGRGTDLAFQIFGAPWINSDKLSSELNKLNLPGVAFKPFEFIPYSEEGTKYKFKYANQKCYGVFLDIQDRKIFKPVQTGLNIIFILSRLYPDMFEIDYNFLSKLVGIKINPNMIKNGSILKYGKGIESKKLQNYKNMRKKYLIYTHF
ncbi:MAG: hypothetical protein IGBAC_2102 [Ignavibacteriae bacterium]|nr:MAG: hypothetical protein IGBAC_2102 [Ignavibacteriota bacterium]